MIKRLNPTPRWSDATVYNGLVHFVEVPTNTASNVESQISEVLSQAENLLLSVGSHKSRLLSATLYITDFANLATINTAWEDWLPFGAAPSRACVKVELADPQMLVEIAFVAATNLS